MYELRIKNRSESDLRSTLRKSRKKSEASLVFDLHDTGAMLQQLSYEASLEVGQGSGIN